MGMFILHVQIRLGQNMHFFMKASQNICFIHKFLKVSIDIIMTSSVLNLDYMIRIQAHKFQSQSLSRNGLSKIGRLRFQRFEHYSVTVKKLFILL